MNAEDILNFWFEELDPSDWYKKDPKLDQSIRERFMDSFHKTTRGEHFSWRATIEGRLAEIIILDQFSRNMFRNDAKGFEYDFLALALSQEASRDCSIESLPPSKKSFIYMPFMHSESLIVHEEAVRLFSQPGLERSLDYEMRHKKIIERFGRYPHRNLILGRKSSDEELEFLKGPGSSF